MAQRNPMNDRYTGDGPQGKTRKSAAKLKPKSEAASSVHIERKPQTRQERKAAAKKREKQIAAKEAERRRKREEREKQERIEAGEEPAVKEKTTPVGAVKKFFAPTPKAPEQKQEQQKREPAKAQVSAANMEEYRKLKRIYWVLMGVGIAAIAISLLINFQLPQLMSGWGMMVPMAVAYIAVIGAIILDYTKIRKLQRGRGGDNSKKSPKQLKHEQEQAEAARLMEEAKKAQREAKRANSKIPFIAKTAKPKGEEDTQDQPEDSDADELDSNINAGGETSEDAPDTETQNSKETQDDTAEEAGTKA